MRHKLFSGLTLMVLGTLALLQTIGMYNFGLTLWPAVILWIGLQMVWGSLFHGWGRPSVIGAAVGLFVAAIGLVKILANAGVAAAMSVGDLLRVSWPLLIVALGLSLIVGRRHWRW